MVINRVGPFSCAKIMATLYALMGLVIGAFVSLIGMAGFGSSSSGGGMGAMFGVGAIIILPIVYGCIGFIATFIGAWLYNLAAGMVGGIELEVQ
jgi:hypothetical protein